MALCCANFYIFTLIFTVGTHLWLELQLKTVYKKLTTVLISPWQLLIGHASWPKVTSPV